MKRLYYNAIILETAVRDDKVMQDFELESFASRGRHSLMVKAPPIRNDYGSKDCVNLSSPTAVSRIIEHIEENQQMLFLMGPRQVGKTTTCHSLSNSFKDFFTILGMIQ